MDNLIIIIVLAAILGLSISYIWKEKKKGRRCIGCPMSGSASCHCNKGSK